MTVNKISHPILFLFVFLFIGYANAQIPLGYYNNAKGKIGTPLRQALHEIIKNHNVILYDNLWPYFQKTDMKPDGKVWDMYSDIPGGNAPYQFTFVTNQCGNYTMEGDCYNREHSFPQSWFNSTSEPEYSDLFHIYPTDGWVNNKRANFPYGDVSTATWTSDNGSKLGTCTDTGYSGIVFEPVDSFKGDFARTYFYMAVRYYMEDQLWPGSDMVDKSEPKPWALAVLKAWNKIDPVSQKERNRNDSIYKIQHNRNPFIDNPQWVDSVWCGPLDIHEYESTLFPPVIYPNPLCDKVSFDYYSTSTENLTTTIFTIEGRIVDEKNFVLHPGMLTCSLDLRGIAKGPYYISFVSNLRCYTSKLIVQ